MEYKLEGAGVGGVFGSQRRDWTVSLGLGSGKWVVDESPEVSKDLHRSPEIKGYLYLSRNHQHVPPNPCVFTDLVWFINSAHRIRRYFDRAFQSAPYISRFAKINANDAVH